MSLNAWIGLLIVAVPAVLLVSIAGAVRICLWAVGDEQSERTARKGTANAGTRDEEHFPRQSSA